VKVEVKVVTMLVGISEVPKARMCTLLERH
jgi:hypothetical protein